MSAIETPRPASILVVDDERSIRTSLCLFLQGAGYHSEVAADAPSALACLTANDYDVVVSDIVLPRVSGVALLQQIKARDPHVEVIMMTGEPTVDTATEAVRAGACDYLAKPIGKDAILRSVANAVKLRRIDDERRRLEAENAAYQRDLESLVDERTQGLENALERWKRAAEGSILAMASTVESRDPYTAGHQLRVAELARMMAREMGLSDDEVNATYHAGMVHDLGKISVPAEILSFPGKLCREAFGLVKKHPRTGQGILSKIELPWPLDRIVVQHHERLDGSGYPDGLSGDQICIEARILAVADVVEAMASHRPYRPARGLGAAAAEIKRGRAEQYDPEAVDACVHLIEAGRAAFIEGAGLNDDGNAQQLTDESSGGPGIPLPKE